MTERLQQPRQPNVLTPDDLGLTLKKFLDKLIIGGIAPHKMGAVYRALEAGHVAWLQRNLADLPLVAVGVRLDDIG